MVSTEDLTRAQLPYEPTDDELREKRRHFLRAERAAKYRDLRQQDQLEAELTSAAQACRERAEGLAASGTFRPQAWHRAIREVILETETD